MEPEQPCLVPLTQQRQRHLHQLLQLRILAIDLVHVHLIAFLAAQIIHVPTECVARNGGEFPL